MKTTGPGNDLSIKPQSTKWAVYLICSLHDDLNVEVLCSHGQQLVVVVANVPCITCDALKLLESGGFLGFAWRSRRRLVTCFD